MKILAALERAIRVKFSPFEKIISNESDSDCTEPVVYQAPNMFSNFLST